MKEKIKNIIRIMIYLLFIIICIIAFGGGKLIKKIEQIKNEHYKEDILSRQQELENKYGINIFIYEDEFLDRGGEVFDRISFEKDSDAIMSALDDIDEILGRLPGGEEFDDSISDVKVKEEMFEKILEESF